MSETPEEKAALRALKRLEKIWPNSLWLFASGSGLKVMKKQFGKRVMCETGEVDDDYCIATFRIENDGGDY